MEAPVHFRIQQPWIQMAASLTAWALCRLCSTNEQPDGYIMYQIWLMQIGLSSFTVQQGSLHVDGRGGKLQQWAAGQTIPLMKLIPSLSRPLLSVVVVLAFIICWLPYHIGRNLFAQVDDYETAMLSQNFNMASMVLCYLSASINPVVYNLMSRKYRAAAKRLFLLHQRPRQAHHGPRQLCVTSHISTLTESLTGVWGARSCSTWSWRGNPLNMCRGGRSEWESRAESCSSSVQHLQRLVHRDHVNHVTYSSYGKKIVICSIPSKKYHLCSPVSVLCT